MKSMLKFFSSLRLTIVLLSFALLVVFLGTLDQVYLGIYEAQKRYFESWIAFWFYPKTWPGGSVLYNYFIPLPGGFLLGFLLIINLICAHFTHFRLSWKKLGITCIHTGLLLLIISGFLIGALQEESQMILNKNESVYFSQNMRKTELVIIDKNDPLEDHVISIPTSLLKENETIFLPNLPFSLRVEYFYPNADIGLRSQNPEAKPTLATRGFASEMDLTISPKPLSQRDNIVNAQAAYITIHANGTALGTWLVSSILDNDRFPAQQFNYENKTYEIEMRFKRTYYPFSLTLIEFTHECYPGTEIPKYFSSSVQLINPQRGEDRQVLIYMNSPLRYEDYTFFQASFIPGKNTSILQVVQNPIRNFPYYAVLIVGLGLIFQFSMHLILFLKKKRE